MIHAKKDDKELGPHLTQQSAQVDHWALHRKTKLMKEHIALKVYFTLFFPFKIDVCFIKKYHY